MTRAADRADQLLSLGRASEALDVVSADPETATDADALVVASRCHHRLGQYERALTLAGAALGVDPERLGGRLMLAVSLLSLDRPVDALAPARRAVQQAPYHAGAHQVLARVLSDLGRFEEATIHANQARSLQPDDTAGWVTLARVQLAQQRWHDAAMSARAALALDPEDDEAKVLLGVAQFSGRGRRGRVEAMETLVGALRDNPDQEHIRQLLIEVAWAGGPSLAAVAVWALIAAGTSGAGLLVMVVIWTVRAVRRWQTVPADVRRLIWADRQARWRVVIAGSALGLFWLGLLALLVGVVLAA
jgi:tetratricopeptide (TPR) repeat protein